MSEKKSFLTYEQQINRLLDRGMIISDQNQLVIYLKNVGFYRLGFYWHELRDPITKKFINGTEFKDIVKIYEFDKFLRSLIFSAIEDIEIYLRSAITNQLGQYGAYKYLVTSSFAKVKQHDEWLKKFQRDLKISRESFLKKTETSPVRNPEIWSALQIMSFGTMQSLYAIMNGQDQHNIAQVFNVKIKILISWLNSLNLLRNGAAHYGYLWNRNFTFPPKFPNRGLIPAFDDLLQWFESNQNNRLKLYCLLCIMAYMLERINPIIAG